MVIDERPSWLRLVFRVHGSAFPRIWRRLLVISVVAVISTAIERYDLVHLSLTFSPFIIVGLPLGIILGFRNSAAYDRYWEGRRLWGNLVNVSRSFTRQVLTLIAAPEQPEAQRAAGSLQRALCYRALAFAHCLRMQLRGERDFAQLAPFLPHEEVTNLEGEKNAAASIVHRTGERLAEARRAGWLDPYHVAIVEQSLSQMMDVQGGCERIKSTPTPLSYAIFIHRAVAVYCILLPFGLVDSVRTLTPLVVFFVAYAFFSLDAIGAALDDPFHVDQHHLPLSAISRGIEIYVRQRLGEADLPPLYPVRDGILD
jgi:ion channel-forming bestrophin family protein